MAEKSDKYFGMQDIFLQREMDDKTAQYLAAREELEKQLRENELESETYDLGQSDAETRNTRNALNNEIRALEQRYNQEMLELKSKNRQ